MDRKKRLVSGLFDDNLRYRPVKDSILIFLSFLMVVIIVLVTFLVRPSLDNVHVEIRYGTTLLWDPEDETRNTAIPFPESGEYTITYTREDGEIFLGEGQQFDFYGEEVAITLYSDRSIQITKEQSPYNVCSRLGRIYDPYMPLACLPNNFQATIVASYFPEWDA